MNALHADAKYADLTELTMYNSAISGVSLNGDGFFYTNPLESNGKHKRQNWSNPPCCPTNIVRFLPEIGSTIYSKRDKEIYINQFIGNEAKIALGNQEIRMKMETAYPWEGTINLNIDPEKPIELSLYIRIPGWAQGELLPGGLYHYTGAKTNPKKEVSLKINGEGVSDIRMEKGYAVIKRKWKKGDKVELELPMQVNVVAGNPRMEDKQGQAVIMRGPLVYCMEETDNKNYFEANNETVLSPVGLTSEFKTDLLNGVGIIHGNAIVSGKKENIAITAIPYYAWCNRGQCRMKVWLPFRYDQ
jgi:DUF1680 family protein